MTRDCEMDTYTSISMQICSCCNQSVCREHSSEHGYSIKLKLNDLNEQIDRVYGDFFSSKSQENLKEKHLVELKRWRSESYEIIDEFYEKKSREIKNYIDEFVNKYDEAILDLKLKLADTMTLQQITDDNLTNLTKRFDHFKQQIEQIPIEITTKPLQFNENLIRIHSSETNRPQISSRFDTLARIPLSSEAMTSNNDSLLIHQNSNLYLYDDKFKILKTHPWSYDYIKDMCWSSNLNSFLLLTSEQIYSVKHDLSEIKQLSSIEGRCWQSCTCSETSLFLTKDHWQTSIEEYSLQSSIKHKKTHQQLTNQTNKQRIDYLEYHEETLALILNDQTNKKIVFELRSIRNFDCLWSYEYDSGYSERKLVCCSFRLHSWIVIDWQNALIIHLSNNGQCQQIIRYHSHMNFIHFFAQKYLIFSTNSSLHVHHQH